ncbi:MAG: cytochrome c-type biogenesis protein [Gemmatimonas sp.]
MTNRREFLTRVTVGVGAVAMGATLLHVSHAEAHAHEAMQDAQAGAQQPSGDGVVNMDGEFYKPVRLEPKPNATPQMTDKEVDEFERRLSCPCPCNLNIFTCRTTDFACGNSPAVHRDIQAMVKGGHSADEIMKAMIGTYGNNILMAPPKEGVNLIAWVGPFLAMGVGAVLINAMLRTWRRNAELAAVSAGASPVTRPSSVDASDAEMERLRKALRDEDNA